MALHSSRRTKVLDRLGLTALYTFTPFKVLRSGESEYTVLLVGLSGFAAYPHEPEWRRGVRDVRVGIVKRKSREIRKKIIMPMELSALRFKPGLSRLIYIRKVGGPETTLSTRGMHSHLLMFKREVFESGRLPLYIEFSYESLNNPAVCRLGYVLLSSSDKCPLEGVCPRFKNEGDRCKYYVRVGNTYVGLYHVYPLIKKSFSVISEDDVEDVAVIPYNGLPLIRVQFTERGVFTAFINAIVLIPKRPKLFFVYRFYLYPQPTIGISISNVHALILEFDVRTLKNLIIEIIRKSEEARKWLVLKYVYGRLPLVRRGISSRVIDGFQGIKELGEVFECIAHGNFRDNKVENLLRTLEMDVNSLILNNDFLNFATFVLVHTLAHVLLVTLSSEYDIPEDNLTYYLEHPILHGEELIESNVRLVVLEDAIGGYGYLKNFISAIKSGRGFRALYNIFNRALTLLKKDAEVNEGRINSLEYAIHNVLDRVGDESVKRALMNRLRNIWSIMQRTHIYPHVMVLRRCFLEVSPELDEYTRNVLEELFSDMPLCWDACPHCVVLEKGCNYTVYDQVFTVSRSLAHEFTRSIINDLTKHTYSFYFTKVKDYVNEFIQKAKREVLISTASLSPITLDALTLLMKSKSDLKVKLLACTEVMGNPGIANRLRQIIQEFYRFEVRFHDRLHAKGILIDGLILLKGSFNFTMRGLEVNVENIDIVYNPQDIAEFKEGFRRIWEEAKSAEDILR